MYSPEATGMKLKELREKAGLSQKEVASKLNLSQSSIAQQESGKTELTAKLLSSYSKLFGVSTDYLLGLSDKPLYEHKIGNRYYFTTSKEPPGLTEGEPEVDTGKTVSLRGDALPANRQELEQFVRKLLQDMLPEKGKSE